MAGYRNHTLRSDDGVLFDVPLPESPVTVAVQPRSLPAYGSTGLASDLGFGGLHETSSSREINDSVSARDYWRTHSRSDTVLIQHSGESRAPLPVPTISQGMIPFSGLHLLSGLDVIEIQQTVELADLMSHVESENRYVVRSVRGETLLVAAECSSEAQRRCLRSSRALTLRVYDPSRQESLHLSRRLACGAGACALLGCCFYLQRVEVLQPPGRPLGSVEQAWSLVVPVLHVKDLTGGLLYRVEGPSPQPWSCSLKEAVFKITGRDGLVELGSISHMWKSSLSSFVTRIVFPSAELDVRHKALLLSAAFLLEYMYFESSKRKSRFPCCS